jgi:hypothetical protein
MGSGDQLAGRNVRVVVGLDVIANLQGVGQSRMLAKQFRRFPGPEQWAVLYDADLGELSGKYEAGDLFNLTVPPGGDGPAFVGRSWRGVGMAK